VRIKSARQERDFSYAVIVGILLLWGLILAYPFYNAILVSITPLSVYGRTPFLIYPKKIDLSAYKFVLTQWSRIWTGLEITALVTILGTAYNVVLTVSTAYALTKPIPGRKFFNYIIVFTMYFSGGLIPFYLLVSRTLHLRNSILSMILPTGIYVVYMLIMRSYIQTIPEELEESAKLDGANEATILFRILLPLCKPMLATVGLYYGVDRWNEWWFGNLFMTKTSLMPLQLHLRNMLQDSSVLTSSIPVSMQITIFPQGIQMAAILIAAIPIVIVYPFLQRYFVKGLVLGAVKG
jgi:putative aldouronate transport system permease protein